MNATWAAEVARYQQMSEAEQQLWLSRLLFRLTLQGRATYRPGGDELDDPRTMRRLNEVMHRLSSHLTDSLERVPSRPDDVFLNAVGHELKTLGLDLPSLIEVLRRK